MFVSRQAIRAALAISVLAIAAPALGQSNAAGVSLDFGSPSPPAPGFQAAGSARPLFAVGGGFQLDTLVDEDGIDGAAPGVSGAFEVRPTESISVILEGVWTGGYEVSPGFTHEHFAHLEGKMRFEFARSLQHRPYVSFGVARIWDRDTVPTVDPAFRNRLEARNYLLAGFGWSLRVRERLEIRPEMQFYFTELSSTLLRPGVSIWYSF